MIQYYIDILNDTAKYKLLVNFHGATLPRGWQRTYPHLSQATLFTDGTKGELFSKTVLNTAKQKKLDLTLNANSGFVLMLE